MTNVLGAGSGAREAPEITTNELERAIEAGYRVALCLTGSAAGAAALVEMCLREGREALALEHPGNGRAGRLLRYLVAAHRRGAASLERAGQGDFFLEPAAAEVVGAIHALPLEERVAVAVSCAEAGSSADAAGALEVSLSEARAHLGRGRRRLRQRLGARPALA